MQGLGDLPGGAFDSRAYDVSGDGAVIVGESESANGVEAVVWNAAGEMQSVQDVLVHVYGLDLAGWKLSTAFGASEDGRVVVGIGVNPAGSEEAWLAVMAADCDDGIDNDGDGLADHPDDPGCQDARWLREDSECDDGSDNDGDGGIDYGGDPNCAHPYSQRERAQKSCGLLGVEFLGLVLLPWLRARRRARSWTRR